MTVMPRIFAPGPIATVAWARSDVPVHEYTTGVGLSVRAVPDLPAMLAQRAVASPADAHADADAVPGGALFPLVMQPMRSVGITGSGTGTLADMIAQWSGATRDSFAATPPPAGASLELDLALQPALAAPQSALVRLRRLELPSACVTPPLATTPAVGGDAP